MLKGCLYTFLAGWVMLVLCVGCFTVVAMNLPKLTPQERAKLESESKQYDAAVKARRSVQETVTAILKSPSTAKFDLKMGADGDTIQIAGHVDSQNSFGAMIRSKIYAESKDGKLIYLTLDDKVLINK